MNEAEKIKAFLTDSVRKDLLKIQAIERRAGMPVYSLSQYLKGQQKRSIPKKHISNLVAVLQYLGYE